MNQTPFSAGAKDSPYGWPLPARLEEFAKLKQQKGLPTFRVTFQGQSRDFPIIRVPLNLPKYRLTNGRTASSQAEFLAKNPGKARTYFVEDPELLDVQQAQHELLLKLSEKQDLLKYFQDVQNKQTYPILLDENGFVVNGNRRLTAWRHWYKEDRKVYEHFANIDVVVLPHCDDKEIDRIEARIQVQKDIKADYTWDAEANMILQKMKLHGFTEKEIGDIYKMKDSEVKELLQMRDCAEEYLKSLGKTDHWSLVVEHEFAFKKLVQSLSKITSAGEQDLFKRAAFILIEKSETVGRRLYEAIPEAQRYLPLVKAKLKERFPVAAPAFKDDGLQGLFGGTASKNDPIDIPLAKAITATPESKDKAREIIVDVVEAQRELKKEAQSANFLVNQLARANKAGVAEQLSELEKRIEQIRNWLAGHA
jgi:hypothetical protein